jgi:hypothetical protein
MRRPPRGRVKVVCQRGALELGANLALAVLDVSETGVRLQLKEGLRPGQEVSITLEGPCSPRPVRRVGRVVWSVPSADGTHCAGVSLDKRLEYREFLDLA